MKLHHIAFWTSDISRLKEFYKEFFEGKVLFEFRDSDFSSCFIRLGSGVILELMTKNNLHAEYMKDVCGYSHYSFEVDSREEVDRVTDMFIRRNVPLQKIKVQYDDGFYESSVLDPDGNVIEIAFIDREINPAV